MTPAQCEHQSSFTAGLELWGGRGWKGPKETFLDFALKSGKIVWDIGPLKAAHEVCSIITISVVFWRKSDFNRYSVTAFHSNTAAKGRKESFRCHSVELVFIAFSWIRSKIRSSDLLSLPTSPPAGCWERDKAMSLKAAQTNTEMNASCTQTQLHKNQNFCWNLVLSNLWH